MQLHLVVSSFRNSTSGMYKVYISNINSNLSCRFRQIPTFGTGTIRRFSNNVSQMKKLAARDFEDILQVREDKH